MEEFSLASPRTDFQLDYNSTENLLSDFDEESISTSDKEEYDQLPGGRYDGIPNEIVYEESNDPSSIMADGITDGFPGLIYNENIDEEACLISQLSFRCLNDEESVLNNV